MIGSQLQPGTTKAEAIEDLRASGHGKIADMVSGMDVVPGQSIDFSALAATLLLVLLLYVGASLFTWLQGYLVKFVVQRAVRDLRTEAQAKMSRSHCRTSIRSRHGELRSRVTNVPRAVRRRSAARLSRYCSRIRPASVATMYSWPAVTSRTSA